MVESVGADRPGRKGIHSAITFLLKTTTKQYKRNSGFEQKFTALFRFEFVVLLHLQVRLGPWELELCHTAHSNSDLVL